MENKKIKAKHSTKPIKKNYKNDRESILEVFLKMKKLKKRNYMKNKNMLGTGREGKKEYTKNYYYKRKKLLNHLINSVEEL